MDDTVLARIVRRAEIEADVPLDLAEQDERQRLEARYGQVWDTTELMRDFVVSGFAAPFVVVTRKSDNATGTLEFQHHPRFYFSFVMHQ